MSFFLDSKTSNGVVKYMYRVVYLCYKEVLPLTVENLFERVGIDLPDKEQKKKENCETSVAIHPAEKPSENCNEQPEELSASELGGSETHASEKINCSTDTDISKTFKHKRFNSGSNLKSLTIGKRTKQKDSRPKNPQVIAETPTLKPKVRRSSSGSSGRKRKNRSLEMDDFMERDMSEPSFAVKGSRRNSMSVISQRFAKLKRSKTNPDVKGNGTNEMQANGMEQTCWNISPKQTVQEFLIPETPQQTSEKTSLKSRKRRISDVLLSHAATNADLSATSSRKQLSFVVSPKSKRLSLGNILSRKFRASSETSERRVLRSSTRSNTDHEDPETCLSPTCTGTGGEEESRNKSAAAPSQTPTTTKRRLLQ